MISKIFKNQFKSLNKLNKFQNLSQFSTIPDLKGTQENAKTAVFMLNLGGPENKEEVTPFLERLFADKTVIRIPFGLGQYIGKIRGPAKVQKQYDQIGGGSPIKKWTVTQGNLMLNTLQNYQNSTQIQEQFGPIYVTPSFRYSNPLFDEIMEQTIKNNKNLENIVLFSQYPQWSCSTAGNNIRESLKSLEKLKFPLDKVKIIDRWYRHPKYIDALATILYEDLMKNFSLEEQKDMIILFSAHSLPVDFVQQGDPYQIEIGTTTNLVMEALYKKLEKVEGKIRDIPFRVTWQSKVGFQDWLKPNTEHALQHYSKYYKNLMLSPMGFTQDHLETLFELDLEYIADNKDKYSKIHRARSLNDHPKMGETLATLLQDCLMENYEHQEYPHPNIGMRCPDCFCKEDCKYLTDYYDNFKQKRQN